MSEQPEQLGEDRLYASIEERGYVLKAYYGQASMVVVAYNADGQEVDRQVCQPYTYEPRWGLDAADHADMERQTELLVGRLPEP